MEKNCFSYFNAQILEKVQKTGFPNLPAFSASLNNGLIPVRMPYPAEEATLNTINYNQAAQATNGNSINVLVWRNE
ncbi:hypothetical protein H2O64_18990 [Kordia sp. YSTF-M3]|uniref:Uncharacterized protein n=1 Tax=Kordia aestuariivivens TaxID=2759037 RepID=A0ABR7QE26_9FLAO|nr:hypothetical protein [Kordia aestuariivivens]MBC8756768.1 hypothetical protein [Kordia aestuariivivens]